MRATSPLHFQPTLYTLTIGLCARQVLLCCTTDSLHTLATPVGEYSEISIACRMDNITQLTSIICLHDCAVSLPHLFVICDSCDVKVSTAVQSFIVLLIFPPRTLCLSCLTLISALLTSFARTIPLPVASRSTSSPPSPHRAPQLI